MEPYSQIGSNTKAFTVILALQLQEAGVLSMDDPLGKWLPELAAQIPNSVLVDSLESAADWVKQNAREGDLVITLGCGDIYKASKMMVKKD